MRGGIIEAGRSAEPLHPWHLPLQGGIHLEALGVRIVETIVQQRVGRAFALLPCGPCSRTCRHVVSVHHRVKHAVARSRFLLVADVAVQVEGKLQTLVLEHIGIRVQDDIVLRIAVGLAQTLLVQIAHAGVVLDALATATQTYVGLVHRLCVVEHLPRVVGTVIVLDIAALCHIGIKEVINLIQCVAHVVLLVHHVHDFRVAVATLVQIAHIVLGELCVVIGHRLVVIGQCYRVAFQGILVAVHHLRTVSWGHDGHLLVKGDFRGALRTALGLHHDYTVGGTRSIDCRGSSILEYGHVGDVVRTQTAEEVFTLTGVEHHVIDYIQDVASTTYPDFGFLTWCSRALLCKHTGHTSTESFCHRGDRQLGNGSYVYDRGRCRHGLGLLYTAVTCYHYFAQCGQVFLQCHTDILAVPCDGFSHVTDTGDFQLYSFSHLGEAEVSVKVSDRTR